MFTGIIKVHGEVTAIDKEGDWTLDIKCSEPLKGTDIGGSIACSGVCLTATELTKNTFKVEVSAETLSKTTIGDWQVGDQINLEESLCMGDELGGHLVFGHVDGLGTIKSITPVQDSHELVITLPEELKRYAAAKGSISINGISLTVNKVEDCDIYINIISHTWKWTDLSERSVGDKVNIEVDMLARYVARMIDVANENRG